MLLLGRGWGMGGLGVGVGVGIGVGVEGVKELLAALQYCTCVGALSLVGCPIWF